MSKKWSDFGGEFEILFFHATPNATPKKQLQPKMCKISVLDLVGKWRWQNILPLFGKSDFFFRRSSPPNHCERSRYADFFGILAKKIAELSEVRWYQYDFAVNNDRRV